MVEGDPFRGEPTFEYTENTFVDKDTGISRENVQLKISVPGANKPDRQVFAWVNLPAPDDEGRVTYHKRSGLGAFLDKTTSLTGATLKVNEDFLDFFKRAYSGKVIEGLRLDTFDWMGLTLTGFLQIKVVTAAGAAGAKRPSRTKAAPVAVAVAEPDDDSDAEEGAITDEATFNTYVASLVDGLSKEDAKAAITSDETIAASGAFAARGTKPASLLRSLVQEGIVSYDEEEDVYSEGA